MADDIWGLTEVAMTNSIVYVSDGNAGGLANGKIASIVQGQSGQSITIEVRDLGNNLVDLTGYSTITGRMRDSSGNVTAIAGTLSLSASPSVAPQVTWLIDDDDTGDSGYFTVIFTFSNGTAILKTFAAALYIQDDPAVNDTPAPGLVGVTVAQAALLATIAGLTGLVEMAAGSATGIAIQSFMRSFLGTANAAAALSAIGGETSGAAATVQGNLNTHAGETTNVHGIADTSVLLNEYIIIALSDETTALTAGTAKATFRMPFAMTLTGVKIDVNTAPTGGAIQVDINEAGTTILSTKLTIDATEETSTTAAVPAVISDSALADNAEITVDIDAVGSTVAGAGLKLTLTGTR